MKAVFEVKTVRQAWQAPFNKTETKKEVSVEEGKPFEREGNEYVFKVVQIAGNKVLVEHDRGYIIKDYVVPQNRQFWLERGEEKGFAASWKDNGISKYIQFKGVVNGDKLAESSSDNFSLDSESS